MTLEKLAPWAQVTCSALVIIGFFGCIGGFIWLSVMKIDLLPGIKEVLLVLIGMLASAFGDVIGFWLGTSAGSAMKTTIMNQARPPQ